MPPPSSWPERIVDALTPGPRNLAIGVLVSLLVLLVLLGVLIANGLKLQLSASASDRSFDESYRRSLEMVEQMRQRSGPTLSERLGGIEQRLEAIGEHLRQR